MKRITLILAALTLVAASCTKSELTPSQSSNAIQFQPANSLSTKVDGSVFPETENFSVYAWTAGTTSEYFMDDVTVTYSGSDNLWKPITTYYWPGNQTVDFFCYYPTTFTGLDVDENHISISNDFATSQLDILYANKAVGFRDNTWNYGYYGVPTLFNHAGARLTVRTVLTGNEAIDELGNVTRWEVTIKSLQLTGIYTSGTCDMDLSSRDNGVIPWTKPAGNVWEHGNAVNTPGAPLFSYDNATGDALVVGDYVDLIPTFYVLPQTLAADQQRMTLVYDIKTYRTPAGGTEYLFLDQSNMVASADLLTDNIPSWQMNNSIIYTLRISPGTSRTPIYFAPAVDDWVVKYVDTTIDLGM